GCSRDPGDPQRGGGGARGAGAGDERRPVRALQMRVLLRWISLRHLWEEPGRTLLTLSGVALGVAVYLAIRLANASALASFSATVDAVAGRANLQVVGGSGGFDGHLFLRVRRVTGVQAVAPVVQIAAPAPGLACETL